MESSATIAAGPARPRAKARPITRIDRRAVRALGACLVLLLVGWLAQGMLGRRLYLVEAGVLLLLVAVLFARVAVRDLALPPLTLVAPPLPRFRVAERLNLGTQLLAAGLTLNLLSVALFSWG